MLPGAGTTAADWSGARPDSYRCTASAGCVKLHASWVVLGEILPVNLQPFKSLQFVSAVDRC
jgi:hypothetical protein